MCKQMKNAPMLDFPVEEYEQRHRRLQAQLAQLAARATELKVASAASASAVQAQRQRLADARSQLAENAEAKRRTDADLADTEALLKDVREKRARLENIRAGLALKLDSRRAAFEQAAHHPLNAALPEIVTPRLHRKPIDANPLRMPH